MEKDYSKRSDKSLLEKVNIILKKEIKDLKRSTPVPLEVDFYPRETIPKDVLLHYVDVKEEIERRQTRKKGKSKTKVLLPTKATVLQNTKTLVNFHNPWLIKEIEKRNLDILSNLKLD